MATHKSIHKGLDKAYGDLSLYDKIICEIESSQFIIFSDHHKGVRDNADDFLLCEDTYCNALNYYSERKFTLILLGDVEDLWECRPRRVVKKYNNIFKLENTLFPYKNGYYYRIHGNHDDHWSKSGVINIDGEQLRVRNKLLIKFNDLSGNPVGDIFLVHGHQGDHFRIISKCFVRYIWRPIQRITCIRTSTPAKDSELRGKHNMAIYEWALKKNQQHEKLICIAGHTHAPVFASKDHVGKINKKLKELKEELEIARSSGNQTIDKLELQVKEKQAELKYRKIKEKMKMDRDGMYMEKPCYFNSGCCSYSDGDITALEIANGMIRLVKWTRNSTKPEALETADLNKEIFGNL